MQSTGHADPVRVCVVVLDGSVLSVLRVTLFVFTAFKRGRRARDETRPEGGGTLVRDGTIVPSRPARI